jgi:hypothetical protein
MCPCVRQASWEAQVIKLFEIWPTYPIFNLVIKTGESRGSSAPATIPSASRSKTTRQTRAGRRWDDSYCGRPACLRGGGQATSPDSRHRPQSARVRHRCPGRARGSTVPAGRVFSLKATWLVSSTGRPAVGLEATPWSPGRPQPGLEAVAGVLHG